jgi:hypothetical protein
MTVVASNVLTITVIIYNGFASIASIERNVNIPAGISIRSQKKKKMLGKDWDILSDSTAGVGSTQLSDIGASVIGPLDNSIVPLSEVDIASIIQSSTLFRNRSRCPSATTERRSS